MNELDTCKRDLDRIIYMWRRYSGKRTPKGKDYSFLDLDELQRRIDCYFANPCEFDWDLGIQEKKEEETAK